MPIVNYFHGISYFQVCPTGYEFLGGVCRDIDECQAEICGRHGDCENLDGGYRCACHAGFQIGDVECEDINECLNNPCHNGNCSNLIGNYECTCPEGYQIKSLDKNTCEDINECLYDNGGCDHDCSNVEGTVF